jgi:hypothetical protein
MSHSPALLFLLCAFLVSSLSMLAGQVPDMSSTSRKSKAADSSQTSALDACALLSKSDVEAALGEPVKETKPSAQLAAGINVSQCLFLTPTFAKSLSVSVASPDSTHSAKTVHEYWNHQFHSVVREEGEHGTSGTRSGTLSEKGLAEGESEKPRFIGGLGQEAYWVGSPITGALYVLQDGTFVRVSVGGIREESTRIQKSKAIATAAVAKLSRSFSPKI